MTYLAYFLLFWSGVMFERVLSWYALGNPGMSKWCLIWMLVLLAAATSIFNFS